MSTIFDCSQDAERERGLALAIAVLKRGGLAAFAADSCYALACDAFDRSAVVEMLKAKGRDVRTPVSVLVPSITTMSGLVHQVSETMSAVAEQFWPGHVTIVARSARSLAWDLGDTGGTVSMRMPVTAPRSVADVVSGLGEISELDVILDSGTITAQAPSSILDLTDERPRLLREGLIAGDQLRTLLPDLEVLE